MAHTKANGRIFLCVFIRKPCGKFIQEKKIIRKSDKKSEGGKSLKNFLVRLPNNNHLSSETNINKHTKQQTKPIIHKSTHNIASKFIK